MVNLVKTFFLVFIHLRKKDRSAKGIGAEPLNQGDRNANQPIRSVYQPIRSVNYYIRIYA